MSMAELERVLKKGTFLSSKEPEDFEGDIKFMREKKRRAKRGRILWKDLFKTIRSMPKNDVLLLELLN